jgi:hypothetical protein
MVHKMKHFFLTTFLIVFTFFHSCAPDDEAQMLQISGNVGDVLIVSTTAQWDGEIGFTLRKHLEQNIYGMPQEEPLFSLIQTNFADFERVFKTFRNVIIVEMDTNRFSEGEVSFHKNVWAKGQLVITIKTSSKNEAIELVDKNAHQIIYALQNKELNRINATFAGSSNKQITKNLKDSLGIHLVMPKFAFMASCDTNHAWIRMERQRKKGGYQHDISQGILIYKFPYTAKQQFLDENIFALRDSILHVYIPGPSEGSFMTTEYRYQPPLSKDIDYDGHFGKEVHGLWRVQNDFMGGPMVSYFVLNEDEGMIYCISGYAYAPQFDKREYYREVEALAKSVRFSKEK